MYKDISNISDTKLNHLFYICLNRFIHLVTDRQKQSSSLHKCCKSKITCSFRQCAHPPPRVEGPQPPDSGVYPDQNAHPKDQQGRRIRPATHLQPHPEERGGGPYQVTDTSGVT